MYTITLGKPFTECNTRQIPLDKKSVGKASAKFEMKKKTKKIASRGISKPPIKLRPTK
jgi:hypothetical protein